MRRGNETFSVDHGKYPIQFVNNSLNEGFRVSGLSCGSCDSAVFTDGPFAVVSQVRSCLTALLS